MYSGMTKSALEWQVKIRNFVDKELIPWEVHAEKNAAINKKYIIFFIIVVVLIVVVLIVVV